MDEVAEMPDVTECNAERPGIAADIVRKFGEIALLMMRDPIHQHLGITDLNWAVLPAILANQVVLLRGEVGAGAGGRRLGNAPDADRVRRLGTRLGRCASEIVATNGGRATISPLPS